MIAFLVREALKEKAGEAVVEVTRELTLEKSVRKKLDELILPELTLNNCTIEEAVEFLRLRSIELSEEEPANRGIGFVVRSPKTVVDEGGDEALGDGFGDGVDPKATLLTLQAKDISIAEALDLICEKAGLEWGVDEYAITVHPIGKKERKFVPVEVDPDDPFSQVDYE